jgi:hypothetical protein
MRLAHIGREPAPNARFREEVREPRIETHSHDVNAAELDDIRLASQAQVLMTGVTLL